MDAHDSVHLALLHAHLHGDCKTLHRGLVSRLFPCSIFQPGMGSAVLTAFVSRGCEAEIMTREQHDQSQQVSEKETSPA